MKLKYQITKISDLEPSISAVVFRPGYEDIPIKAYYNPEKAKVNKKEIFLALENRIRDLSWYDKSEIYEGTRGLFGDIDIQALPDPGVPLSLQDIADEFGGTIPHGIDEYYAASSDLPTQGNPISISDFYGTFYYEFDDSFDIGTQYQDIRGVYNTATPNVTHTIVGSDEDGFIYLWNIADSANPKLEKYSNVISNPALSSSITFSNSKFIHHRDTSIDFKYVSFMGSGSNELEIRTQGNITIFDSGVGGTYPHPSRPGYTFFRYSVSPDFKYLLIFFKDGGDPSSWAACTYKLNTITDVYELDQEDIFSYTHNGIPGHYIQGIDGFYLLVLYNSDTSLYKVYEIDNGTYNLISTTGIPSGNPLLPGRADLFYHQNVSDAASTTATVTISKRTRGTINTTPQFTQTVTFDTAKPSNNPDTTAWIPTMNVAPVDYDEDLIAIDNGFVHNSIANPLYLTQPTILYVRSKKSGSWNLINTLNYSGQEYCSRPARGQAKFTTPENSIICISNPGLPSNTSKDDVRYTKWGWTIVWG